MEEFGIIFELISTNMEIYRGNRLFTRSNVYKRNITKSYKIIAMIK